MPNAHAPEKEVLSFYLDRRLSKRVRKLARKRGQTLTACIVEIFTHATDSITLAPEEVREIQAATEHARRRRARG